MPTSPYSGTIYTHYATRDFWSSDYPEFFKFSHKLTNRITISVKASQNAQVILYHEKPESEDGGKPVEPVVVTLGGNHNTVCHIGRPSVRDPYAHLEMDNVLSATHYKEFEIEWNRGRIALYNEGYDEPFIWWQSPQAILVDGFGIRTDGCSGEWILQGAGKPVTTTDSKDYQHFKVNSGRFDFEVKSTNDAYITLTKAPKNENPRLAFIVGGWGNNRGAIFINNGEVAHYDQVAILDPNEYRRFWIKWDTTSASFGVRGESKAKMRWENINAPLDEMNYFAVNSSIPSRVSWHIFEPFPIQEYEAFRVRHGNTNSSNEFSKLQFIGTSKDDTNDNKVKDQVAPSPKPSPDLNKLDGTGINISWVEI